MRTQKNHSKEINGFPGVLLTLDSVESNPTAHSCRCDTLLTLVSFLLSARRSEVKISYNVSNLEVGGILGPCFSKATSQLCECLPARGQAVQRCFRRILTLCPGWGPVLSWALGTVVHESPTHISAAQDWQDPNTLRQRQEDIWDQKHHLYNCTGLSKVMRFNIHYRVVMGRRNNKIIIKNSHFTSNPLFCFSVLIVLVWVAEFSRYQP